MAIHRTTSGLIAYAQSILDRVVSPSTRQSVYNNLSSFAREQPLLASFLTLPLLLSLTPLLIFTSFTLGIILLSLVSGLLFSLFWIGIALLVLVPTLFVTVGLGVLGWVWGVSVFAIGRWVWGVLGIGRRIGNTEGKGGKEMVNGDAGA